MKHLLKLLTLSTILTQGALAHKPRYSPQVLAEVQNAAQSLIEAGQRPVVIFDLDDTLINTKVRTVHIFKSLSMHLPFVSRFPGEALALQDIRTSDIHYLPEHTLAQMGVEDPAAIEFALKYWNERFFSSQALARDYAFLNAPAYVQSLGRMGVQVVYLTGRDSERMEEGTIANLLRHNIYGFELENGQINPVSLYMKPSKDMSDAEFKISAFDEIAKLGTVISVFENEPKNLNLMIERFPDSIPVFVDSQHSPGAPQVFPEARWIKHY